MATAGGIRAGRAYVEMGVDDTGLGRGLKAAEESLKGLGKSVMGIGAGISGLGAAIVTPLLGMAKAFADSGSELHDMSTRTGISVEALSALGYAAKQSGADLATVEGGVRKMQKALVAGSEENMKAEETFMSLGLSVERLMAMNPQQQFATIARAISAVPNPTAKAAAAMAIFGKTGTSLLPMIEELPQLTSEAAKLGLIMSTQDANAADTLGDSMDAVTASFGRITQVIGASLAPLLTSVAQTIMELAKVSVDWINANRPLVMTIFKIGAGLVAAGAAVVAFGAVIYGAGIALGVLHTVLGGVFVVFNALNAGLRLLTISIHVAGAASTTWAAIMATVLSPAGLLIAAIGGIAAAVYATGNTGTVLNPLMAAFNSLKETAVATFKGISDAMKAGDIALAGQILWAGLKVEFTKGINYVKALWAGWGTAAIEVFRGVSFMLSGLMVDAWAAIQSSFVKMSAFIRDEWAGAVGYLAKQANNVAALIQSLGARVANPRGGQALQDKLGAIEQTRKVTNEFVDKGTAAKVGEGRGKDATALQQIETNRVGSQAALKDQQQAEIDARRKAAQEGLAGDAEKLKAAQDEFAGLVGKAGKEAMQANLPVVAKKAPAFTPEALDQTMEKAKVSVAGTFSGLAAGGLGAGANVADQQLKEQKKATDELVKLNKKVDKNRTVFS